MGYVLASCSVCKQPNFLWVFHDLCHEKVSRLACRGALCVLPFGVWGRVLPWFFFSCGKKRKLAMSIVASGVKDAVGNQSVHELDVLYDEARAKINRLEEIVCKLEVLSAY